MSTAHLGIPAARSAAGTKIVRYDIKLYFSRFILEEQLFFLKSQGKSVIHIYTSRYIINILCICKEV